MDLTRLAWSASLALMLLAACGWDVAERRIPNAVVVAGAALALAIATTRSGIGLGAAVAGAALALIAGVALYALRAVGAGDAKLLAAVGAYVGFPGVVPILFFTLLAGGLLALAWALRTHQLKAVMTNIGSGLRIAAANSAAGRSLPRADDIPVVRDRIPYAVAIALGVATHFALAS